MSSPSTLKQSLHAVTALAFKTFGSPASPAISDYSSTPTIGKAGFQNDDKAEMTSLTPHALHQAFRSYLSTDPEVASSHPHLSYYSSQTDTQFNALAHNVYKEVVRRDAMTPVPQLSPPRTSSVPVNPLYRHDFSRYSDENLKAVVRNVDAELVRRHPQVAEITNGIFAPQPRRAGTTIPSDVTSAQLPSIRHVQSSRRMLTPNSERRLSICTVPARIQSPLRRASSRSPASSPYSSEYDWVSSDLGSDDIGDDVESCGESPVVGNKFRARELRRRDSEIHRLKGQLVEAQTKLRIPRLTVSHFEVSSALGQHPQNQNLGSLTRKKTSRQDCY
ncbi:hypothetical protein QCA50_019982 [Cerrena zonata]|uniref:Uncharacterized protein n=1 Tax=Cerrena zonata TaxID=2478898 RepID=A0AAW0FCQ8_9APHY